MKNKEEFNKLIDNLLTKIMKEGGTKEEIHISAEEAVIMLRNLNQQIEKQKEDMDRLSEELEKTKKEFHLLIRELVKSGYLKISERRNLLKRNMVNQEALTTLLLQKKIISKNEILDAIKRAHNANQGTKPRITKA